MNNRPLFWAVMCFALGEVIYIIAGRGYRISTALVVLICAAFLLGKINLKRRTRIIYLVVFVLGFARILCADNFYMENILFGKGEYVEKVEDYGGYSIFYLVKDSVQDVEENVEGTASDEDELGFMGQRVSLIGIGIIDNIIEGSAGYNITVKLVESSTPYASIHKEYKVIIYGVEENYDIGDVVCLEGVINDFVPTGNPGEFDRKNYYKARGIVGYGNGIELGRESYEEIEIGSIEKSWYKLKNGLYKIRRKLSGVLYDLCDEDVAGIYLGILLGEKNGIPDNDMLLYRLSGIAHIFAISGLHISIVGGLMYKLLRRLGLTFLPAAAFAMVVTVLYGLMTGLSFSTIRAIIMLGLSLGGEVLGRKYDMLTGMGLALGVLVLVEPFRMLDGGLILSFGAVAGVTVSKYIVYLLEKRKKFRDLKKKKTRWIYGIVSSFIFSSGISLITTPLISYMYYQFPFYSVLLNMIVVPLMTVTVYCGFFGTLVGCLNPFLGRLIIFPGALSLKLYQSICELFQMLPFGVINTGKPEIVELIVYYLVLAVILVCVNPEFISRVRKGIHTRTMKWIPYMKLRAISVWIMVGVCVIGLFGIMQIRLVGKGEEIIFLDVGQGDGVLIRTEKGTNIVIDVGSSSNESLGEYVACPALLAEGMGTVDYWFVSHFDKDHVSGLEYILTSDLDMGIVIKNLVVSENCLLLEKDDLEMYQILKLAEDKEINVIYMKQGDSITDGTFTMKSLHPSDEFDVKDKNEQSLVLSYQSEYIKVLFTGDIGGEAINKMLAEDAIYSETMQGDYDVIKVPHHGSKYSMSMDFYQLVNSEVAIISCGRNNIYGHPHKEVVDSLETAGNAVYRCDRVGMIRLRVK